MFYAEFLGENGYDYELEEAKGKLIVGNKYLLRSADVGGSSTRIHIEGHTKSFNSVMFEYSDENGEEVNIYRHGRGYFEFYY